MSAEAFVVGRVDSVVWMSTKAGKQYLEAKVSVPGSTPQEMSILDVRVFGPELCKAWEQMRGRVVAFRARITTWRSRTGYHVVRLIAGQPVDPETVARRLEGAKPAEEAKDDDDVPF